MESWTQTESKAVILSELHHESIIELKRVIETKHGKALVLPLAHKDLGRIIYERGRLAEDDAKVIMMRLFNALDYCHTNGTWHRDVKPDNILVMSSNPRDIRLADFGHAINSSRVGSEIKNPGTLPYLAREVFLRKPRTEKVDIWSAGVVLFTMIVGDFPYRLTPGSPGNICIEKGLEAVYNDKRLNHVSEECRDLFWRLMAFDPERRLSAREGLEHEWFKPRLKKNLPGIAQNRLERLDRERKVVGFGE
jgi:serine/threonine protein kinase